MIIRNRIITYDDKDFNTLLELKNMQNQYKNDFYKKLSSNLVVYYNSINSAIYGEKTTLAKK